MPPLRPEDLPPVDLESMQQDHTDQVEMLGAVCHALEAFDGTAPATTVVDEAMDDFAEHTREHFRQEDDQMLRFQFPAFEAHTEAHVLALQRMDEVIALWRESRNVAEAKRYFEEDFPGWLVHHVDTMDTVCAVFVAGNGIPDRSGED